MRQWELAFAGDRALLLKWQAGSGMTSSERARYTDPFKQHSGTYFGEIVPAYDTLLIPIRWAAIPIPAVTPEGQWNLGPLMDWLEQLLKAGDAPCADGEYSGREVVLPVRYGGQDGPDLAEAAHRSGLTETEFIRRYGSGSYEVAMIGFAPGFPYLTGLPPELAQPRLASPRLHVPAGAIGIAGGQTGVYSVDSPGGWQIIGRTSERLFRPEAEFPFLLRPGDLVRFVEAKEQQTEVASSVALQGESDRAVASESQSERAEGMERNTAMIDVATAGLDLPAADIVVMEGGLHTTVQASVRTRWQAFGVSAGGPIDAEASQLANALVGNASDEALLELTLLGGKLMIERNLLAAITGADMEARINGKPFPLGKPVLLRQGSVVHFGRAVQGCRSYLAVAGGIEVPPVLGSKSTDVRARIGGVNGRAIVAGDTLRLGQPAPAAARLIARLSETLEQGGTDGFVEAPGPYARGWLPVAGQPGTGKQNVPLRLLLQAEQNGGFTLEAQHSLLSSIYHVKPSSNRMGLRLSASEPLPASVRPELTSHGVMMGTVQIPSDGLPLILAADAQPTGGYPVIGHVISADWHRLGQLRPGDEIRFNAVLPAEALEAGWLQERDRHWQLAGIQLAWYVS